MNASFDLTLLASELQRLAHALVPEGMAEAMRPPGAVELVPVANLLARQVLELRARVAALEKDRVLGFYANVEADREAWARHRYLHDAEFHARCKRVQLEIEREGGVVDSDSILSACDRDPNLGADN